MVKQHKPVVLATHAGQTTRGRTTHPSDTQEKQKREGNLGVRRSEPRAMWGSSWQKEKNEGVSRAEMLVGTQVERGTCRPDGLGRDHGKGNGLYRIEKGKMPSEGAEGQTRIAAKSVLRQSAQH